MRDDRAGRRPRPAVPGLVARALVALAALVVLGAGAVEVLPRTAPPAPAASAAAPAADRSSMSAPAGALQVRTGGALAGVPAPTGPGEALAPGTGPLLAAHLVAQPQSRPPTAPRPGAAVGAPGSRAPPAPAGT